MGRRAFLLAAVSTAAGSAMGQVEVGESSRLRSLVPASELELAAAQQYGELLQQARAKRALAPESHPQLQRLRAISSRLIADAPRWNERARGWRWEVNLIGSDSINAFCMPGGKIAVFTGLIDKLQLTEDELAMVVRSMPASRSRKPRVPSTSSKGSPAEKPRNSIRSVAGSV